MILAATKIIGLLILLVLTLWILRSATFQAYRAASRLQLRNITAAGFVLISFFFLVYYVFDLIHHYAGALA